MEKEVRYRPLQTRTYSWDPKLIGGLAGAGIGGVAGLIADNKRGHEEGEGFISRNRGALMGALGGGAAGAVAGHFIGGRHNQMVKDNATKFGGRRDREIELLKSKQNEALANEVSGINKDAAEALKKHDQRSFLDKILPINTHEKRAYKNSKEALDKLVQEEVGKATKNTNDIINKSSGKISGKYDELFKKAVHRDSEKTWRDAALAGAGLAGAGALGVAMTKKKQPKEDEVRKQSRYFNRVTDFAIDNAPLLGAIGGAGLGGYLGYQRNKDTTNPYRGAAIGALAGGAAGYGLASIAQVPAVRARSFEIMQNPDIDEVTKQRALAQSRAMDRSMFNIFPAIKRPGLNRLY